MEDELVEKFIYSRENDLNCNFDIASLSTYNELSKFDILLRGKWQSAMDRGYFRYNLDEVKTKVIEGKYNYVAQLNVKRATERRPPARFTSVNQMFNHGKFNFTKIHRKEVLFQMEPEEDTVANVKHEVIINVSPIEYGHILLVPFVNQCLPQILTVESLVLALDMVLLSSHGGFRIGWNSVGAFASVNHLHYHALYLDYQIYANIMPVLRVCDGIYETMNRNHGFVFQLQDYKSTQELARMVCLVTDYLKDNELAHNLTITRGICFQDTSKTTLRILLSPGKPFYGAKNYSDSLASCFDFAGFLLIKGPCEDTFNSAALEKAGHLPVKDKTGYDSMTEEKANQILEKYSLSQQEFDQLKGNIQQLALTSNQTQQTVELR